MADTTGQLQIVVENKAELVLGFAIVFAWRGARVQLQSSFKILILVKSDIVGSALTIKNLEGNFAAVLGSQIKLRNSVNALGVLPPDNCLERHAGIEKHDFDLDTAVPHLIFNPRNKCWVKLVHHDYFDVWDVARVSSRDLQILIFNRFP